MIGTVLFWKNVPRLDGLPGGYGFINELSSNRREDAFWFGGRALLGVDGRIPRSGDTVEFEAGTPRPGRGPIVKRVTRIFPRLDDDDDREKITTLGGIDDVS